MPTTETFLKTAAYFEDRARRTRQNDKRERLLAAALKYRERAAAGSKRDTAFARTADKSDSPASARYLNLHVVVRRSPVRLH